MGKHVETTLQLIHFCAKFHDGVSGTKCTYKNEKNSSVFGAVF